MRPIRIGLVGVFHRAHIAKYWHDDPRAEVVAGCDIEDDYLREFKEQYGEDTFVTKDYNELAQRDDLDVIAVFTPDNLHMQPTIAALRAGKDVFCEKPMAITIQDCDAMIAAEKESGRKLMIGFNMRYMDLAVLMKDIVDSGEIGPIHACWMRHFVGFGGFAYFHDYRARRENSTSMLLQKACHDIDCIHFVTGQHTQRVVGMGGMDVYGGDKPNDLICDDCGERKTCLDWSDRPIKTKRMCCFREEVDIEDHSMIMMQLDGGVRANYMQCHYTTHNFRNYYFIGARGTVESISDTEVRVRTTKYNRWRGRNDPSVWAEAVYNVGASEGDDHFGCDPKMCKAFLDYIVDDIPPKATSWDGRMSVATGVLGAWSIRNNNMPVDIPPLGETPFLMSAASATDEAALATTV